MNKEVSKISDIKFIADRMLGRLAKWLRVLGYDTTYSSVLSFHGIISKARKEWRTILTRDKSIESIKPSLPYLFIRDDQLIYQLRQVVNELGLDVSDRTFSRCLACNGIIKTIRKNDVKHLVPDFIYNRVENFFSCSECKKIYWPGSHIKRMEALLDRIKK